MLAQSAVQMHVRKLKHEASRELCMTTAAALYQHAGDQDVLLKFAVNMAGG